MIKIYSNCFLKQFIKNANFMPYNCLKFDVSTKKCIFSNVSLLKIKVKLLSKL